MVYDSVSSVLDADRAVALKRFFWKNAPDWIVKEMNWLCVLDHPNVVRLLVLFRESDQATVVINYVGHVPLGVLLSQLKGDHEKHYMKDVLAALVHIHDKKIIHPGVKVVNCLFDRERKTGSLIYFGLCDEDLHLELQRSAPDIEAADISFDLAETEKCQNRPWMIARCGRGSALDLKPEHLD
jgi:cell division control protein 7